MSKYRHRVGFTLVELLVVMAIIGVLIALLLPAVQAARESARTAHCKNNLHQLALGVHHFQEAKRHMPRYWGTDDGVWGNWFTHTMPYLEEHAVYEGVYDSGGSPGRTRTEESPAVDNGPYTPGTRTCVPPTRTCLEYDDPGAGNTSHTGVGHTYEDPPASPRCIRWSPQTCTTTGGSGTPPTPAVYSYANNGIDAYSDKLFETLQCPSDPYKRVDRRYFRYGYWTVTNYLANWHAFSDGDGAVAPYNEAVAMRDLLDGTSNTILFGEAYSYCDGVYRLAMYGDCFYRRIPGRTHYHSYYPSASFGLNWYADPNTYMFQHLPPESSCNNWRLQGMHPGGGTTAMADGSVRVMRATMSRQEITNPQADAFGSGDPDPINVAAAEAASLRLGVWDRFLLPRDGEAVQAHQGAPE